MRRIISSRYPCYQLPSVPKEPKPECCRPPLPSTSTSEPRDNLDRQSVLLSESGLIPSPAHDLRVEIWSTAEHTVEHAPGQRSALSRHHRRRAVENGASEPAQLLVGYMQLAATPTTAFSTWARMDNALSPDCGRQLYLL